MLLLETKRTLVAFRDCRQHSWVELLLGGSAMKTLRRFLARVGNLVGLGSSDLRLREEIAEHVALQTEDNLRAGMSPVEARRQAMLKFGGIEAMKEEYRSAGGLMVIENMVLDVRYAIRSLERTPGLTAFVIFT